MIKILKPRFLSSALYLSLGVCMWVYVWDCVFDVFFIKVGHFMIFGLWVLCSLVFGLVFMSLIGFLDWFSWFEWNLSLFSFFDWNLMCFRKLVFGFISKFDWNYDWFVCLKWNIAGVCTCMWVCVCGRGGFVRGGFCSFLDVNVWKCVILVCYLEKLWTLWFH